MQTAQNKLSWFGLTLALKLLVALNNLDTGLSRENSILILKTATDIISQTPLAEGGVDTPPAP